MKTYSTVLAMAALALLWVAPAWASPETLRFVPLDTTAPMLSPDPHISLDLTTGTDYANYNRVANVSALGYSVDAESGGAWALVGVGTMQMGYKRMFTKMTLHQPAYSGSVTYDADVYMVKWAPNRRVSMLPANGQITLGAILYFERSPVQEYNFQQPFIALGFDTGPLRLKGGYNWTEGELDGNAGYFASLQWVIDDNWLLFADYSKHDFNKLVLNDVYLPRLNFDCSQCPTDALNAGVSTRLDDRLFATVGMFDIQDLEAVMGSLSMKWDY